jgi:HEAT repeat protein
VVSNKIIQALPQVRVMTENDPNNEVKRSALAALATMNDFASQNIFVRMLNNSDRAIRYESAKSLAMFMFPASVSPISNRLMVEQDDEIKEILLDTLLRFKKIDAVSGIVSILRNDSNLKLRIKAAYILGIFKNDKTLNDLLEAARDADYRLRTEACNSLGNFKNSKSIEMLFEKIQNDKIRYVRSAALYCIVSINDRKSIIALYDLYCAETEPVFKEMMRRVLRKLMTNYI